jgi:lipid A 3-O-deacylase
MFRSFVVAILLAGADVAQSGEVVVGLGYDDAFDRRGGGAAALSAQLVTGPRAAIGPVGFGFGAAIEADTDGDVWAGAGVTAEWPFARDFRLEGSLMAGGYAVGDGGDELGSALQFRSRIGISHAIRAPWRLGVALEHKSNGRTDDFNPGIETVFLTVSRGF